MLKGILSYAHHLLEDTIETGETAIDATSGNGNDTLFLAKLVGENGKVIGFDIQKKAINATKELLQKENITNVSLIHKSHETISEYLEADETIGGAIFNLGYLPGSDKVIVTKPHSTITALKKLLDHLKKKGKIILVVYHGHAGGKEEKDALLAFVMQLEQKEFNVLRYEFINQKNDPPFIIAIEKK